LTSASDDRFWPDNGHSQDVFASVPLKQRIEEWPFQYLRFSEGLSGFAGAEGI
jgi:hypothetical protein